MTLQEIINLTRRRLGDFELPYDWTDAELVDYLNYAIAQISRRAYMFEDGYTPAICNITTVADTLDYALSSNIVEIKNVRVTGELGDITQTGTGLDDIAVCGNYTHSDTDTDFVVQIDGVGTPNTFKWSDDGGSTWDATTVSMTGAWQELSHGIFVKFAATTGHTNTDKWEFTVSDNSCQLMTLTTQQEMYDSIPTWRQSDSDVPYKYMLDYRQGYITFHVPPDAAYLINMNVTRYPSTDMTTTSMSSQTPDIPSHFHMILIDGILYQAYLKTGSETYNEKKSSNHLAFWKMGVDDLIRSKIINVSNRIGITPHAGTL